MAANEVAPGTVGVVVRTGRGRLFRKYVAMFLAIVSLALVINGVSDIWFSYQEQKALLVRIQRGQVGNPALLER
jgi:hypothetical protein